MGRKNTAARNRGRKLDRRPKGERRPSNPTIARVPVDELIVPDGHCDFRSKAKARFGTEAKAKAALDQAQRQRARNGSLYVEKRYYECPQGGCGGWHLTSRERYDEAMWKGGRA